MELIVTMSVVSIAVLALTYTLSSAFARQSDGLWQAKTVALAEAYVEEIMARRYDETTPLGGVPPCPPVACSAALGAEGESRGQFDDVDDYNGLDEQPPRDADGNVRADYDGYRVQVSVAYATAGQVGTFGLDDASDAKLVTVTVSPPSGAPLSFAVLRGNY